jgi:hypothetical protein
MVPFVAHLFFYGAGFDIIEGFLLLQIKCMAFHLCIFVVKV